MRLVSLLVCFCSLWSCSEKDMRPADRTLAEFESISKNVLKEQGIFDVIGRREFPESYKIERSIQAPQEGEKPPLVLGGVESLTANETRELAQWRCRRIFLPHLKSLSLDVAKSLILRPRYYQELYLDGLPSLDPEVAKVLVDGKLDRLSLRGFKTIDPTIAHILAKSYGSLDLGGLEELTVPVAQELAKYKAFNEMVGLSLDGLKSIDPQAAKILGSIRCWLLSLGGIEVLTVKTISDLSIKHRPFLRMPGVTHVDAKLARALVKYWDVKFFEIRGVSDPTDEVTKILTEGFPAVTFEIK